MSREELKKYLPDSPDEWAQIGSSVNRLGAAMSLVGVLQEKFGWVLITVVLTWAGHEISEYFKLQAKKNSEPKK